MMPEKLEIWGVNDPNISAQLALAVRLDLFRREADLDVTCKFIESGTTMPGDILKAKKAPFAFTTTLGGVSYGSALVSTTSYIAQAKPYANRNTQLSENEGYMYLLATPKGSVSRVDGKEPRYFTSCENLYFASGDLYANHLFSFQDKYSLPGGCDWEDVIAYRKVESNRRFIG